MIKILVQKIPIPSEFRYIRSVTKKERNEEMAALEEEKEKGERRKDGGAGR